MQHRSQKKHNIQLLQPAAPAGSLGEAYDFNVAWKRMREHAYDKRQLLSSSWLAC
jgi:hypothetical protein